MSEEIIPLAYKSYDDLVAQIDANDRRGIITDQNSDTLDTTVDPAAKASLNADPRNGQGPGLVSGLIAAISTPWQLLGNALNPLVDKGRSIGQRFNDTAKNLVDLPANVAKTAAYVALIVVAVVVWLIFRRRR